MNLKKCLNVEYKQNKKMELTEIRKQIDQIDTQLLQLLAKRFALMPHVIAYKKARNLPIQDPVREKELIAAKQQFGEELGVDEKFVEQLFELIMAEGRRLQED